MQSADCRLCKSQAPFFNSEKREYFLCPFCKAIFVGRQYLPNQTKEKERYLEHNNNISDSGYQNFVTPVVKAISECFSSSASGLDYGAGTGPVVAKMLSDSNYKIELFDPFFYNNPELLENTYDFIICCEVAEHFHYPEKEFELLRKMLNPNGKLFCQTSIFHENIDFKKWYYKNDFTHVFFYQKETFEFIKKRFGFTDCTIKGNLIVLLN